MYQVKQTNNSADLEAILNLRYEILRKPWNQSKESASDALEETSVNAFIEDNGKIIACGRLQENEGKVGQIRYMAVDGNYQGKGLGKLILKFLEEKAKQQHLQKIELQARGNA